METCSLIRLRPHYSWAKEGVKQAPIVIPGRPTEAACPGMTRERPKAANVQKPDRPAVHPRPRAARGEPVPRQQPEDELAARVRRAGDRSGDGRGLPHRRGPAAALDPLLFHPARRSADPDHLPGRAAARRQELFDPPRHRDPARQRHLLDHGVVPCRGAGRVRSPGEDAGRAAAGETHRGGSLQAADVPRDAGLHPPLLRIRTVRSSCARASSAAISARRSTTAASMSGSAPPRNCPTIRRCTCARWPMPRISRCSMR